MTQHVKRNTNGYRIGESHQRAKFTDHEIELIRQLAADGMKGVDLAKKFEATKGYISRILRHLRRD